MNEHERHVKLFYPDAVRCFCDGCFRISSSRELGGKWLSAEMSGPESAWVDASDRLIDKLHPQIGSGIDLLSTDTAPHWKHVLCKNEVLTRYPDATCVSEDVDGCKIFYIDSAGRTLSNTFPESSLAWVSAAEFIRNGRTPTPRPAKEKSEDEPAV